MKCFDLLLTVVCMFLKPRLQWIHSDSSTVGKLMLMVFFNAWYVQTWNSGTVATVVQWESRAIWWNSTYLDIFSKVSWSVAVLAQVLSEENFMF